MTDEKKEKPIPDGTPASGEDYEAARGKLLRQLADSMQSGDVVFDHNNFQFDETKQRWIELDQHRDAGSVGYKDFPQEIPGADVPLEGKRYEQYRAEHFSKMADILRKRVSK